MNANPTVDFADLAESKEFRQFFEIVRALTGIRVVLADPDGARSKWLFHRDEGTPLCRLIHSCASGNAACLRADRRHYQAALRQRKAIHYICHAGLIDFVVPIYVGGAHVATINGGQILPEPPTEKGFRACRRRLRGVRCVAGDLRRVYFQSPYCSLEKAKWTMELLAFFAEYFGEVGWRLKMARQKEIYVVKKAKQFIHDHFRESIGLSDIAGSASLSPAYFSSMFHQETGKTVVSHLQEIRIQAARRLLDDTRQTITEIALQTGFNNLTHFNRVFRKLAGCSPSEYRQTTWA